VGGLAVKFLRCAAAGHPATSGATSYGGRAFPVPICITFEGWGAWGACFQGPRLGRGGPTSDLVSRRVPGGVKQAAFGGGRRRFVGGEMGRTAESYRFRGGEGPKGAFDEFGAAGAAGFEGRP